MKKISIFILCSLLAWMLCACESNDSSQMQQTSFESSHPVSSAESEAETSSEGSLSSEISEPEPEVGSVLEVHYINVGQGDATLLLCGEDAMLIDGGNNAKGTAIWKYLREQNVEKLKYVIATHPDADHIGGLDVIVYKFDVKAVFMPQLETDTKSYRDLEAVLTEKALKSYQPKVGETFELGEAKVKVIGPVGTYENSNDYSIAVTVTHGDNTFLFTGDASVQAENEMAVNGLIPKVQVYKAGHHGSSNSSSGALLDAAEPEYAIVSCGYLNSHGHPHEEVMSAFKERDIKLFRTDLQGTIVAVSDGQTITFNGEPTDCYDSGRTIKQRQEELLEQVSSEGGDGTYILNNSSMKFHLPLCEHVVEIADHNRQEVAADREELITLGYEPCGVCKP